MSSYTYEEIREVVCKWCKELENDNRFVMKVVTDSIDAFIVNFDFECCVAQLCVNVPDFAPYRFVCFEACRTDDDRMYFFYDDITMKKDDVIRFLNESVEFCVKRGDSRV